MAVTIKGPEYLIGPQLPNGSPNPFFPLATYLAIRATGKDNAINVDVSGGVATISGIEDISALTLETGLSLVAAGAEVLNYPVWIAIPEADYETDVPEYLPYGIDAAGNRLKWSEWKDASHEHALIDGKYYVGGNSATGSELPLSIVALLAADEFELLTYAERLALNAT